MKHYRMSILVGASAMVVATLGGVGQSQASDCGSVTLAEMNWASASLMANVDKLILEYGYGCDAELVPGDTQPTGVSMAEKGEPDIASEFWSNAMREAVDEAVAEGRLADAGSSLIEGGEEGFWVPKYMVEKHPELTTIEGVKKHVALFPHPEDESKGMFMNCPAGWNCQISATNLFKALKLEDAGFEMVDPGSGAGLDGSIAKAYERGEGWFGYYWAPTSILGKYEMVKVDLGGEVDQDYHNECITQAECEPTKVTAYPPSRVDSVTTAEFATNNPDAFTYIQKRGFMNADMNKLLAWMDDNQADGETAAYHFLESYENIWTEWVPAEVAEKIKSQL